MGFVCGLDVSSDTAEPQQIDGRGQQFADQLGRREMVRLDLEAALHLGADWDGFGAALENAAARRNHRAVIVGPARPRQPEQTLPLCEATLDIGVGVDKDMPVIEGGAQPQVSRHQHAVAEHVARHVADADDADLAALDIPPELAEVALDQLPGAAGGDAHLFVVVAGRPARGKSVAEPEPILFGYGIGKIGEGGGALVRRNHQVGIVVVVPDDLRRRNDAMSSRPLRDDVVRQVEQAADQRLVTFDPLGPQLLA